jgi:endonuclease YncB( thermonuclease family)
LKISIGFVFLVVAIFNLFAICTLISTATAQAQVRDATMNYVVDGDTYYIIWKDTGERVKIRLLNVDTPESVHPIAEKNSEFGKITSNYAKNYVRGKKSAAAECSGSGYYGRPLCYLFLDGENVNLHLVRMGYSPYYVKYGCSSLYNKEFLKAEAYAIRNNLGVWSLGEVRKSMICECK